MDMTMREAVEYLSSDDQKIQHCAASYIQHNTFIDDKTKDEVVCLLFFFFSFWYDLVFSETALRNGKRMKYFEYILTFIRINENSINNYLSYQKSSIF